MIENNEENVGHVSSSEQSNTPSTQMESLSGNDNQVSIDNTSKTSNIQFLYAKRPGTSGIGGQLYETKLLSLLLHRALNNKEIQSFNLATNIEGIGEFDDIILKYETHGEGKPKVLFIQAKHKEHPDQNKLCFQDMLKDHGDFSLYKYFESYLKIRNKFSRNNDDDIFKHPFGDVDCDFIIYTSAMENIRDRQLIMEKDATTTNRLLRTNTTGKAFKLVYDDYDVDKILSNALDVRMQLLGKIWMKFLFKNNYINMLEDDLIKTYHVYLAQNVIEIIPKTELNYPYLEGRFQEEFLVSENRILTKLREAISREFTMVYGKTGSNQTDELMKTFIFKLPLNFGNINFYIAGSSAKVERRLKYICSKIKLLIDNATTVSWDSCLIVIKIHDNIGPTKILQQKDLEMYRLGGLVGNLLVLDEKTMKLMFNESVETLPPIVAKLFEMLRTECPEGTDFNKYRFDVSACRLPRLFIIGNCYEWLLLKEFLSNLIFYTNQACEHDVEKVLKSEIYKHCEHKDTIYCQLKSESIFLKVHDAIQKWWKQPNKAHYLNSDCKYFSEAQDQLFKYSLLNTLHTFYTTKLSLYEIKFQQFIDEFERAIHNLPQFLNIVTSNVTLTSIKLLQYLQRQTTDIAYIFVNLDFIVSENCFDDVLTDLKEVKQKVIFITCESSNLYDKLIYILELPQLSAVAITKKELPRTVARNLNLINYNQLCDQSNTLIDLCIHTQKKILKKTNVMFQGVTVPLKNLISNKLEIIDTVALFAILNEEIIQIGREFTNTNLTEFEDCYVERTISRCISMNITECDNCDIIYNTDNKDAEIEDMSEITIVSDKVEYFIMCCEKYKDKNVHWFVNDNGHYIWQKSRGSLDTLSTYIDKSSCHSRNIYNPMTLLDIDEKVIILCAAPGMGKSTLMTYLSIETKIKYPNYWILRINCLDHKNLFSDWQVNKITIDLKQVIKFLYKISLSSNNTYNDFDVIVGMEGDIYIDNINNQKLFGLAYLEVEIFNNLYNEGQMAIIFDGFDEISPDYLEQVTALLVVLSKSKICRLWITTRPYNIIDNLELILETFAFTLQKLSSKDQIDLFTKLWGRSMEEKINDRLKLYVENFVNTISIVLQDIEHEFTSIPLHIYMIAEIYQDFFKDYYNPFISKLSDEYMGKIQDLNFFTLYEKFINNIFYNIRFGKKKPYIYDRDPDLKKMIEMLRIEFITNHKLLAAHTVFDRTVSGLFSDQDKKRIYDILECIRTGDERTGIIETVVRRGDEPKFVHFTFAEYFAVEYICDKLKTDECSVQIFIYLFDTIFVTNKYMKLRSFFNSKLLKDEDLQNLTQNFKYKQEIFNTLLKQRDATALLTFTKEFSERNAMFLLNCVKTAINKNNLSSFINFMTQKKNICCTFCHLVDRRFKNVTEAVLGLVKDIDSVKLLKLFDCEDVPLFNALGLVISYSYFPEDRIMLDTIMTAIDDVDIFLELFTMPSNMGLLNNTIIHVLVLNEFYSIRLILEHLLRFNKDQRAKIFSTRNADGKLAAHLAAEQGDLDFFAVLDSILDRDQFEHICSTYDNIGRTPLDYLRHRIQDVTKFDFVNTLERSV